MNALEIKLLAGLALVMALLVGLHFYDAHQQALGAAAVTAAVQHEADVQTAKNTAETARRQADQQENLHEAIRFNTQRAVDGAGLDAVVQRVHDNATSSRLAAAHPAAAGASQAQDVPAAAVVPAELYVRALDALAETAADAADLTKSLDCLRGVSELCAKDYDSLNGSTP